MKLFDSTNHRLVFLEEKATSQYWDTQWNVENFRAAVTGVRKGSFVHHYTAQYLPLGARILEGGCGKGQFVYALKKWGYAAVGVDYAEQTVKRINQEFPELDVIKADVMALPFEDNSFDGYWSFGVIEHFFDGYDKIATEMHRVLKHNGYVFMTFPYMSPLRRFKAWAKQYPAFDPKTADLEKFYQFGLSKENVQKRFEEIGFECVYSTPLDGVKGLKDEVAFLRPLLQRIYNPKNIVTKGLKFVLDKICRHFSGHVNLLILRVKKV